MLIIIIMLLTISLIILVVPTLKENSFSREDFNELTEIAGRTETETAPEQRCTG